MQRALANRSGADEMIDVVSLLVTEVVTNALLHARTDVHLDVKVSPDVIRVEVADGSSFLPVSEVPGPDQTGGRGLFLVDQLASSWGSELLDDGKVVWFEVDARRTA